ncbi:MAG: hypothetical protein ACJA1C_000967 [Crocinitomicaceae bacterium]|jgi:hypothetical protein
MGYTEKHKEIISKIADLNFQKKVWVQQKVWDEVLNFGEAVNLLDDYSFFDDIEDGNMNFDNSEFQSNVESFAKRLLDYEEISPTQEMLNDPKWLKIVELANKIITG